MIRPGCMASAAGCDPRQQHIARFHAGQRLRMATYASKTGVRPVIESRMRHPARGRFCLRYIRQAVRARSNVERVALLASLSPEQVFSLCRAFRNPLRRSEDANLWRQRLASQVPIRIALDANFAGVRGNVFAELSQQERMHYARLVMRHAFLEVLV